MSEKAVPVIFRKYKKDGQIIALFPTIPGKTGQDGSYCMSYMHVGQHGPAYLGVIRSTVPATEDEYRSLYLELVSIGYVLHVVQRFHKNHHDTRRSLWSKQVDTAIQSEPKDPSGADVAEYLARGVARDKVFAEDFVRAMTQGMHRTLQQCAMSVMYRCMEAWAEQFKNRCYDARNEQTVKTSYEAVAALKALPGNEAGVYFPHI